VEEWKQKLADKQRELDEARKEIERLNQDKRDLNGEVDRLK